MKYMDAGLSRGISLEEGATLRRECSHCQPPLSATLPSGEGGECKLSWTQWKEWGYALHALARQAGYEPNAWYESKLEDFIQELLAAQEARLRREWGDNYET